MEKFVVPPDDCLILKAFRDSKSLREAAGLLGCDPAGLARRVQQISNETGCIQKVQNRWQVTARGLDLTVWTEGAIESQKQVLLSNHNLRIATTMWFAEEVLVPNVNKLRKNLGKNAQILFSVPAKGFELALVDGSIDFAIVCHPPENPEVEHKQIAPEKWILVAPYSWQKDLRSKGDGIIGALQNRPFVRHSKMNPDLFMPQILTPAESGFVFDNLIGVRAAVCHGLGWSIVPKLLVNQSLRDRRTIEIAYDLGVHDRKICVWWLRNRIANKQQSSKICNWVRDACL